MRRTIPGAIGIALLATSISGCVGVSSIDLEILNQEPTEEDQLPADFTNAGSNDANSARLLISTDDVILWATTQENGAKVCLLVRSDSDSTTCTTSATFDGGGITTFDATTQRYYLLVPDGWQVNSSSWIEIAPNLLRSV